MELKPSSRTLNVLASMLLDILVVIIAYTIIIETFAAASNINYTASLAFVFVVAVVNVSALYALGVYQRLWSRTSGHEATLIIYAVILASLIITVVNIFYERHPLPFRIVILGNLISCAGFIVVRYRSRLAVSFNWRWRAAIWGRAPRTEPTTRVLIVGAGESGQALAWRMLHRFNYRNHGRHDVVGFIDDDPEKQKMFVEGRRVLGTRNDIRRIAREFNVELIVIAIHHIKGTAFREILQACEQTNAMIKVVPDLEALVSDTSSPTLLRDVQAEDLLGRNPVDLPESMDLSPVMSKVILISGAAGSIGSELSRQIMEYKPTKAILLDNNESGLHDLNVELRSKFPDIDIVPALADITIHGSVKMLFSDHRPQIVFHAAAYKHVPMLEYYPGEAIRVNIGGTKNIASLAQEYGVERFVLISSDKAVNPSNIMGASKRSCELLINALSENPDHHTLFASVRFGNVLGSRGSVVPTFNQQIESGGPVTVTDENMTRYFMSIPEAVNLIIHAACLTHGNDIYVLQMGEEVPILELAERMIRLRGLRPYKDIEIKFTGVRPGEKLHEELFHGDEKPAETKHPHIMRVNNVRGQLDRVVFFEKLEELAQNPPDNDREALSLLHDLITSKASGN